jgi:hypothetical protein
MLVLAPLQTPITNRSSGGCEPVRGRAAPPWPPFALRMPGAGFSHILPGFPVAEGSWQRQVFAAGDSRSIPQGAQASSGDAEWHHMPSFLLP